MLYCSGSRYSHQFDLIAFFCFVGYTPLSIIRRCRVLAPYCGYVPAKSLYQTLTPKLGTRDWAAVGLCLGPHSLD